MADILAHQPDSTVQTIDRSEQAKPKAKYEVIDSLRFEVAFFDKRGLYAWPGSKKFDDTSILDMVPDGAAIATGVFAGHAQYLFRSDIATVKIAEWATDSGRRLARYPFTVPINRSRYVLMKSKKESSTIGYSGNIWVDPSTVGVTRITLHADAIPAKLEIQATSTIIEYGAARIVTETSGSPPVRWKKSPHLEAVPIEISRSSQDAAPSRGKARSVSTTARRKRPLPLRCKRLSFRPDSGSNCGSTRWPAL